MYEILNNDISIYMKPYYRIHMESYQEQFEKYWRKFSIIPKADQKRPVVVQYSPPGKDNPLFTIRTKPLSVEEASLTAQRALVECFLSEICMQNSGFIGCSPSGELIFMSEDVKKKCPQYYKISFNKTLGFNEALELMKIPPSQVMIEVIFNGFFLAKINTDF